MSTAEPIDRRGLMKTAAAVYAAVGAFAIGLAWLMGVDLVGLISFRASDVIVGIAAVVPMAAIFFLAPDLKDRVVELLGRALSECRMWELVFLAAAAGVTEELLFRGALEGWLRPHGTVLALIVVNVLFGLCHPMTFTYFLIATGLGVYFSVLTTWSETRQITSPIVAHSLYDLVGFLLVASDYRKQQVTQEAALSQDQQQDGSSE